MDNLEAQVRALQTKITQAQREQAKAEQARDAAVAVAAEAQRVLMDEFGVSGLAEAKTKLATMQEYFKASLVQINETVEKAAPKDGVYR